MNTQLAQCGRVGIVIVPGGADAEGLIDELGAHFQAIYRLCRQAVGVGERSGGEMGRIDCALPRRSRQLSGRCDCSPGARSKAGEGSVLRWKVIAAGDEPFPRPAYSRPSPRLYYEAPAERASVTK